VKNAHIIPAVFGRTAINTGARNTGLDVLRALCAIAVVLAHSNNLLGKYIPVYKVVFPVGAFAQEVFFSLSGFLIGGQILRFLESEFKWKGLFVFYSKRWIRTIPFYFFFLLFNYALYIFIYRRSDVAYLKMDFDLGPYFLFLQNFNGPHPVFYPEIWPIPVEEWSYFLIPLVLLAVTLAVKKGNNHRSILVCIVSLIILITIVRMNYVLTHDPEQDWYLRKIVIYRLDALLYGVVLAILMKKKEAFLKDHKNIFLIVGLLLSAVICFLGFRYRNRYINSVLFTLLPMLATLILPYFRFSDFRNTLNNKLLTHVSLISYSILLSHLYFLQFLFVVIISPASAASAVLTALLYFPAVILFSTLFYNFVERPVLLLRKDPQQLSRPEHGG
jgi:peptidoglycan/LPS O-acetylase OafA/YrhL